MAHEQFFHRARASDDVEGVWKQLQLPSTWAEIGGVERLSEERLDQNGELLGYRFVIIVGGSEYLGIATRSAVIREKRMVMQIDSTQVRGEISVDLEPDGDATWVALSLSISSKGFFSSALFPLIVKGVAGGFDDAAARFVNSLNR
ncbi:MAG TPA: hypothetical protein VJQ57_11305 [Acidimicrobiia bacterium]|nr:hypothetical protein [Acidimicrobiia bacterium]